MPADKPKMPDRYPFRYHETLRLASANRGVWMDLMEVKEIGEARLVQRKFRAFLRGLEVYPLHPSARAAKGVTFRTRTQEQGLLAPLIVQIRAEFPLDLSPLSKVIEKSY